MSIRSRISAAALPLALVALGGCAHSFDARVNRFSMLAPPAQGQTFSIQAADRKLDGSIEFRSYAQMVAAELERFGYRQAAAPSSATMVVTLDYFVDNGRERVTTTPGFGGYGGWAWGGWGGWGWRSGWPRGWALGGYHPFWGPDWGPEVRSYTVYNSQLRMEIARTGTGERVFEGTARATSRSDELPYLVPNLIRAMFTGFPGNSGETIRVNIPQQSRRVRS
jgi:hypothetical protein